jgi:hypothetical protein
MNESMASKLNAELDRWQRFEDCLLSGMSLIDFGYSLKFTFNYIWTEGHHIRPSILENPCPVIITLEGVDQMTLLGGLTPAMKDRPDLINWGLSEVSQVVCTDHEDRAVLSVRWEGDRRIDVIFTSYRIEGG